MILMWSCPGNMPKYYPGLRDILPDLNVKMTIHFNNNIFYNIGKSGENYESSLYHPFKTFSISHLMFIR